MRVQPEYSFKIMFPYGKEHYWVQLIRYGEMCVNI